MKKVLLVTMAMLSLNSLASYVLMAGIAEARWIDGNSPVDAMVYDGNSVVTLEQFFGGSLNDAGFRVQLVEYGTFLNPYYEENKTMLLSEDGDLGMSVSGAGGYSYAHLAQFDVSDDLPMETMLVMELGEYDSDDNFIPLAASDIFILGALYGEHTYEKADLNPPTNKDWAPPTFYAYNVPIPEPTTAMLLIIGACALLAKRKT